MKAGKTNPHIRQKAAELIRYVQPKDWCGEIHTIFEFVRDRIRYLRDIRNVETLHDARQVMEQGQGDCDDKAILLASLLESVGHPTRFVALGFRPGDFSHVITQTLVGKKWLSLDPTEPVRMGWAPKGIVSTMVEHN